MKIKTTKSPQGKNVRVVMNMTLNEANLFFSLFDKESVIAAGRFNHFPVEVIYNSGNEAKVLISSRSDWGGF